MSFSIQTKHGRARTGILSTPHGDIRTPAFVVVGTKGTVKGVSPEEARALGGQAVLGNTYHLYLQPGDTRVREAGGLHRFMNWDGPLYTDSGGYQVFSLARKSGGSKFSENERCNDTDTSEQGGLVSIDTDGVTFRSHIDGSKHRFTPERSMEIQHNLGADIMFAFDECTPLTASYEYQKEAMERTHAWARRSLDAHARAKTNQQLFGIVQGGKFEDLRRESARVIGAMSFDGYGLGASYAPEERDVAIAWMTSELPEEKPRHLLGVGEINDIFAAVAQGVDTFDCVTPTRLGRTGTLETRDGRITITNALFRADDAPIEQGCGCYTCTHYTKRYLFHLFRARELFAYRLASIHNLYFFMRLFEQIRNSINSGKFEGFALEFQERYYN